MYAIDKKLSWGQEAGWLGSLCLLRLAATLSGLNGGIWRAGHRLWKRETRRVQCPKNGGGNINRLPNGPALKYALTNSERERDSIMQILSVQTCITYTWMLTLRVAFQEHQQIYVWIWTAIYARSLVRTLCTVILSTKLCVVYDNLHEFQPVFVHEIIWQFVSDRSRICARFCEWTCAWICVNLRVSVCPNSWANLYTSFYVNLNMYLCVWSWNRFVLEFTRKIVLTFVWGNPVKKQCFYPQAKAWPKKYPFRLAVKRQKWSIGHLHAFCNWTAARGKHILKPEGTRGSNQQLDF